jgi:hypothetical protein
MSAERQSVKRVDRFGEEDQHLRSGEAEYIFPFCGAPRDNLANAQGERSTPMSISTRLKSFLDENQIPYSVMTHTRAYTAQGAAATMQISGKELAKTVVLWTGEEMILAVLPAPESLCD